MKNVNLKDYLRHVYDLEASCYKQRLFINNLQMQEHKARNPNWQSNWTPDTSGVKDFFKSFGLIILCPIAGLAFGLLLYTFLMTIGGLAHFLGWLFSFKIGFLEAFYSGDVNLFVFAFVIAIIGLVIGVCISTYIIVTGKAERKEVKEHNKQAEQDNNALANYSETAVRNLQKQISIAKSMYSQTEARLKQAYGLGVIHPKYRNLVAVARFYEYFDTGRCSTLQGHEGAYNIYETEIRLDKIITDLDDIKNQLEQIRANQYTIYQAVKEGINISNRISNVIADCNNRLANIESNSEVSAYYSKITAENTTFDLWYKWLNN